MQRCNACGVALSPSELNSSHCPACGKPLMATSGSMIGLPAVAPKPKPAQPTGPQPEQKSLLAGIALVVSLAALGLSIVAMAMVMTRDPLGKESGNRQVTKEVLTGKRYETRTGPRGAAPRFEWTFSDGRFTIEAGPDAIPKELLEVVVGVGKAAKKVEGNWRLEGSDLVFSDVTADGAAVGTEGRLSAGNTGVIRITIPGGNGQHQYLFGH